MSWKRSAVNSFVRLVATLAPDEKPPNGAPSSIFVLRNNDLGDLLVVTPLFEALRRAFPSARLVAGIGRWNVSVLENNPHVDAVMEINAPWHNKFVPNQGLPAIGRYLLASPELKAVRQERFQIGIDVLGSPWGTLSLMRCGIPCRLSVRGYAGGEAGAQQHVQYKASEHVGRSALRFAELLGAPSLPSCRPQLFLRPTEIDAAENVWRSHNGPRGRRPRLLLGPGVGFPNKGWPETHWADLLRVLAHTQKWNTILTGAQQDKTKCDGLATSGTIANLAGKLTLRETFALAATSDRVVCHSSMLWHAAAAWEKPTVVLLGECFPSATAHATQWGYPESIVLGREQGKRGIATVGEVLNVLRNYDRKSALAA